VAFWDNPVVAGVLGVALGGGATAYIQSMLSSRAKASEELRERRFETYPVIWKETAPLHHVASELTWSDVELLHLGFRRWYFTSGGLFLSKRSIARLNDLLALLSAYLAQVDDMATPVEPADYTAIALTCASLRRGLSDDLATRRQRSLVWLVMSWRRHRVDHRKAQQRIEAAGGGSVSYPLDKLRLPDK
jgi:hypothetical protein